MAAARHAIFHAVLCRFELSFHSSCQERYQTNAKFCQSRCVVLRCYCAACCFHVDCLHTTCYTPNAWPGARHLELYADEVARVEQPRENLLRAIFWEGDTQGDAFMTAAAAQVCTTTHQQIRTSLFAAAAWQLDWKGLCKPVGVWHLAVVESVLL